MVIGLWRTLWTWTIKSIAIVQILLKRQNPKVFLTSIRLTMNYGQMTHGSSHCRVSVAPLRGDGEFMDLSPKTCFTSYGSIQSIDYASTVNFTKLKGEKVANKKWMDLAKLP